MLFILAIVNMLIAVVVIPRMRLALTFITAALTVLLACTLFVLPRTNLFVIAVVGTAMISFTMPGRRSVVAYASPGRRDSVAGRSIAGVRHLAHPGE